MNRAWRILKALLIGLPSGLMTLGLLVGGLSFLNPQNPLSLQPYWARAQIACGALPYTFVNGTLADATQVNANFAAILNCLVAANSLSHVTTNNVLAAQATTTFPQGVWRDDYATGYNAGPLFFKPETGSCATNSKVNDGGSCTNSADGNSFFSVLPPLVDVREFGVYPNGTTDLTPFYNNLIAALAGGAHIAYWPGIGSIYEFKTQPNCIQKPIAMMGPNRTQAVIQRDYSVVGGTGLFCLVSNGAGLNPSGTTLSSFYMQSTAGTTGGSLISIVPGSGPADNIGKVTLRDITMTNTGTADCSTDYDLLADGSAATSAPQGIRDLTLDNVEAFGTKLAPVYANNFVGFSWTGGGEARAGCAAGPSVGGVVLTGAAGVTHTSNYFNIAVPEILDAVSVDNTIYGVLTVGQLGDTDGVSVANASTATNINIIASRMTGTAQANWLLSCIRANGNAPVCSPLQQESHVNTTDFSSTSNVIANIPGLSQVVQVGTYSCSGWLHFTTAPTNANGVQLQLASDAATSAVRFVAAGYNAGAFASSGFNSVSALNTNVLDVASAFTDIQLSASLVVTTAGTLNIGLAESTTSGTIAVNTGNARWECHRAS